MAKTLFPYQKEAIRAFDRDFAGGLNRVVGLLFPGGGKTFTMANYGAGHLARFDGRILVGTHRAELMDQIQESFEEVAPHLRIGRVRADENEPDADVVIGSIPTLVNPERLDQIKDVSLVMVDECHRAVAPSWMGVLHRVGSFSGVRTIGWTGTLVRHDQLGLGDVWQRCSIKRSIDWGVKNGYLVPSRMIDYQVPDLTLIDPGPDADGDYSESVVAKALLNANSGPDIAAMHLREVGRYRSITFTGTKAVAYHVSQAYNAAGITSAVITGDTKREDRREIYAAHKAGEIQDITNVGVLTEGYNDPGVRAVVDLTITRSEGLAVQKWARANRVDRDDPSKTDCVIIRARGTVAELVTHADLRRSAAPHTRKPAPKTPSAPKATVRPPKRSDIYRAKTRGPIAMVWRDDVLIATRKANPGQDPARLARLLIDLDIAERTKKGTK